MEREEEKGIGYRVTAVMDENRMLSGVAEERLAKKFASAREALLWLERQLNQAVFHASVVQNLSATSAGGADE